MKKFKSIVPVLITPLDKSGEVCKDSLLNLLHLFDKKKCSGLWVLGTGGEDMCLSFKQRVKVAEIIHEFKTEMKICVGASFFSPKESLDFMKLTKDFDFSSYHAMPYHPKVSSSQLFNWYSFLNDHSDKKIWAYTSGNWAQRIDANLIKKVKNLSNFEGVKYSTSNIVDLHEVALLQDDNFQVISAVIKTFFSALNLGLEASTSIEAMLFYDEIDKIYKLYSENKREEAFEIQNFLNLKLLKYPNLASKDNFLRSSEIKYLLYKLNLIKSDNVTFYYRGLTESEKNEMDQFLLTYQNYILNNK